MPSPPRIIILREVFTITCLIETHWDNYDPKCSKCREEVLEVLKNGSITQEEYDGFVSGKLKVPGFVPTEELKNANS